MSILKNIEEKLNFRWQQKGLYQKLNSIIPDFKSIDSYYSHDDDRYQIICCESRTKFINSISGILELFDINAILGRLEQTANTKLELIAVNSMKKFDQTIHEFNTIAERPSTHQTLDRIVNSIVLVGLESGFLGKKELYIHDKKDKCLYQLEINHYKGEAMLQKVTSNDKNNSEDRFIDMVFGEEIKSHFSDKAFSNQIG